MKKQELIHLHGLLAQVCDYYEATADEEVNTEGYAEVNVDPTSIHKSKTEHKTAVFALAGDITDAVEHEAEQPVSAAAD